MMTHPRRSACSRIAALTLAGLAGLAGPCLGGAPYGLIAQTPAPGEADPGVRFTRMIDRAEVRVSRIELQAGATRRVHTHDDVVFHLWIPIEGSLQITIDSAAPVPASSGQAFFMTRGTRHGFTNAGTTPGAAIEVFVKQTAAAAGADPLAAIAGELAALTSGRSAATSR